MTSPDAPAKGDYPYSSVDVAWKRPPVDREILKACGERSDVLGLLHCLGSLAILGASGALAYLMFATRHWGWMAAALYVHGGLHAFQPQTHEFVHGTVLRTRWLNGLFKRVFGLLYWPGNEALFKLSHAYHHRYTLHRQSEGEEVHPRAETTERILQEAVRVVDPAGLLLTLYDQVYFLLTPFLRNTRRSPWQRYTYANAGPAQRRDVYWTHVSQLAFHALFAAAAIAMGQWFLVVVVSLPAFYGGKWYYLCVHDTMHVGRQPESDDFRLCCRTTWLDPVTSFLFWHMEYHTEHHAFPAVPCYRLRRFHRLTREHWQPPMSLVAAWREMNRHSWRLLGMPTSGGSLPACPVPDRPAP